MKKDTKPLKLPAYFGSWRPPKSDDIPDVVIKDGALAMALVVEVHGTWTDR